MPAVPDDPEFLTLQEAARLLSLSDSGIRLAIRSGRLPAYRYLGQRIRLRRQDVLALLEPIVPTDDGRTPIGGAR